jgi:hypothetical protein
MILPLLLQNTHRDESNCRLPWSIKLPPAEIVGWTAPEKHSKNVKHPPRGIVPQLLDMVI